MKSRSDDSNERTPLLDGINEDQPLPENESSSPRHGKERLRDLDKDYTGQEIKFTFTSIPTRKKFVYISMAVLHFGAATFYSLLAPFFPGEAKKKGVPVTIIGMIFGGFELVVFLSCPIFGNYITQLGAKFMFVSGIMVCGTCAILFGLLDKCPDGTIFIVMCFLVRFIEALGTAAFCTASFAIVAKEFQGNVLSVFGSIQTFDGIGLMIGPPIGGALYQLGGFGLPFFVMGGLVVVIGSVAVMVMPSVVQEKEPKGSFLTLARSPYNLIITFCVWACSSSISFLNPTLAEHLSQFHLKPFLVGMVFLVEPAMYGLFAPLMGRFVDKKPEMISSMMIVGLVAASLIFLLLGPAPFLTFIPPMLWLNIVSLLTIGFFYTIALIPTFQALMDCSKMLGLPDDLATYGKVSGLYNAGWSFGAFLGPVLGGALVEKYSFPWTSTGYSAVLLLSGVLLALYTFILGRPKPQDEPNMKDIQSSKTEYKNQTKEMKE